MKSYILKFAIFATGLSGIVAEYILSTLATYFLGDSVVQWTLIISVMLFSMGLGSRISRYLEDDLVVKFVTIEFLLSLFVGFSPLLAYTASAYTPYTGLIIYLLAIIIGIMIGMEIPLVIRLNSELQELKINVSSVIENDYYGSLLGGLFFVFVGLPILGLTYTPFVLGMVNFSVAMVLVFMIKETLAVKFTKIILAGVFVFTVLVSGFFAAEPIIFYGEQAKYKDKIIYQEQSKYQKIVITEWKNEHWFYLNGNLQLSTLDEYMYHEPLIHPAMNLVKNPTDILILGGGDGNAAREILKYESVKSITLVDLDPAVTNLAKTNPIFTRMNKGSMNNPKVNIINADGYNFVEDTKQFFDVIFIDLPDPRSVELGRLYSYEFYLKCSKILRPHGVIITQAGSPYYATKAFLCVEKTMREAGFNVLKMHNQVLTMGEWGWVLGSKSIPEKDLKAAAQNLKFDNIKLRWLNNEAMKLVTSFGKDIFSINVDSLQVNSIHNPVLYRYYLDGNWDWY